MNREVVITGVGVVAPGGIGQQAFWESTVASRVATGPITKFDTDGFEGAHAGEVSGFEASDYMPARLARKLDPYTQYAIAACRLALDDGQLDPAAVDRQSFGVYVGNCFGGWEFTDRELRNLHTHGVREVSAFQATAWFPAAPQGQISILLGLRGQSKTIVCDRASGAVSVALGARTIQAGQCDVVLAGGCEALVNPFSYLACLTEGTVDRGDGPGRIAAYRPFDERRAGLIPGEGGCFLLLEEEEHARNRGARIYGRLLGAGMTNDACHPQSLPEQEEGLSRAMSIALGKSDVGPESISFVMADAMGNRAGDRQEAEAIHKVFGKVRPDVPVAAPKVMTGHLYGAAGALDLAWGALSLRHGLIPPTPGLERRDPLCDVNVSAGVRQCEVSSVMINARGSGGINASVLIGSSAGN